MLKSLVERAFVTPDICRRTVWHGMAFTLAKGSVLVAPLLAARFWDAQSYGQLEWNIAVATVAGTGIALGAPSVVAFEAVSGEKPLSSAASVHVVLLAALMMIAGLAWRFWGSQSDLRTVVGILLAGQVALQLTVAGNLKGAGYGALASFGESGIYLVTLITIVLHIWGWKIDTAMLFACLASQLFLIGMLLRCIGPNFLRSAIGWFKFLQFGPKIMISSFALMLLSAAPRLFLGHLAGNATLAEFALSYRWLTIALVAHQFIGTVFFRTIYRAAPGDQDRRLVVPVAAVGGLSAAIAVAVLLVPASVAALLPFPLPSTRSHAYLVLIAAAIPMWSGVALMEGIFYRERKPLRLVIAFLSGFIAAAAVFESLLAVSATTNVPFDAAVAWLLGLSVTATIQWIMLLRMNFRLIRLGAFLTGVAGIGIASQVVVQWYLLQ